MATHDVAVPGSVHRVVGTHTSCVVNVWLHAQQLAHKYVFGKTASECHTAYTYTAEGLVSALCWPTGCGRVSTVSQAHRTRTFCGPLTKAELRSGQHAAAPLTLVMLRPLRNAPNWALGCAVHNCLKVRRWPAQQAAGVAATSEHTAQFHQWHAHGCHVKDAMLDAMLHVVVEIALNGDPPKKQYIQHADSCIRRPLP